MLFRSDGYLDSYHSPRDVRVRVRAWWTVFHITDQYMPQPREWRRVWNYYSELGLRQVLRKVLVRTRERSRDQKVLGIGIGTVATADFPPNDQQGEVHVVLEERLEQSRAAWTALLEGEVAAFNRMLQERNLPRLISDEP